MDDREIRICTGPTEKSMIVMSRCLTDNTKSPTSRPAGGNQCWLLWLPLVTAGVIVSYLYSPSPAVHLQNTLWSPTAYPGHQLLINTTVSELKKVLLVTYYRGGSSFLGQLFNQNIQAMYWFEPLRAVRDIAVRDRLSEKQKRNLVEDTLLGLLSCNLSQPPEEVLQDDFISHLGKSQGSTEYSQCLKASGNHSACLPLLSNRCSMSKLRVVKTISLPVKDVRDLLKVDPKLKVIYYHRDPRAMMWSLGQIHHHLNFRSFAKNICNKIHKDLEHYEFLHRQYPDSMFLLKYEDVAKYPFYTTKKIYSFINETLPESVLTWIEQNTQTENDNMTFGTQRNSIKTLEKWRHLITDRKLNLINSQCHNVLEEFGYS